MFYTDVFTFEKPTYFESRVDLTTTTAATPTPPNHYQFERDRASLSLAPSPFLWVVPCLTLLLRLVAWNLLCAWLRLVSRLVSRWCIWPLSLPTLLFPHSSILGLVLKSPRAVAKTDDGQSGEWHARCFSTTPTTISTNCSTAATVHAPTTVWKSVRLVQLSKRTADEFVIWLFEFHAGCICVKCKTHLRKFIILTVQFSYTQTICHKCPHPCWTHHLTINNPRASIRPKIHPTRTRPHPAPYSPRQNKLPRLKRARARIRVTMFAHRAPITTVRLSWTIQAVSNKQWITRPPRHQINRPDRADSVIMWEHWHQRVHHQVHSRFHSLHPTRVVQAHRRQPVAVHQITSTLINTIPLRLIWSTISNTHRIYMPIKATSKCPLWVKLCQIYSLLCSVHLFITTFIFHCTLKKHQTDFVCKLQKFILSKCLRINCPLATKKQKKKRTKFLEIISQRCRCM